MIKHRLLWDIQQRRLTFDEWKYINPLSPVYVQGYEDRRYINQFFSVVEIEDRNYVCTLYSRGEEINISFNSLDRVMLLEKEEAVSLKLLVDATTTITQEEFNKQLEPINQKYKQRIERLLTRKTSYGIDYLRSTSHLTNTILDPTTWITPSNASVEVTYSRIPDRWVLQRESSETNLTENNTS